MRLSSILVFYYTTLSVFSHCMLDMRLDYENNLDAIEVSKQIYKKQLQLMIVLAKQNIPSDVKYNLLRKISNNFNQQKYFQKLNEKSQELKYNVLQIIANYCEPISSPILLGEKLFETSEYDTHRAKCNIKNNQLEYSRTGRFDVMINKIPITNYDGLSKVDNFMVTLSRVATHVRMSECLLNPQAYNVTNPKFNEIYETILERTSALSGLLQNISTGKNLDSIPAIQCTYFTPNPKNKRKQTKGFNDFTIFYLTYPLMISNLENLFFYQPELLTSYLAKYPWLKNSLVLRIHMSLMMIEALSSLHKSGIIHKNIRLSNIFYHDFPGSGSANSPDQIYLSFGNFSESGIDDYDKRVMKTFFIPDDILFELGPKVDIYQLGLVITQLTFMIATENTPEMSLSKIAKMTSGDFKIIFERKRVHLFEQLMTDAIQNNQHYDKYENAMTPDAARCSIEIFKHINAYFHHQLWSSHLERDNLIKEVFYNFEPDSEDAYRIVELYKYPPFKSVFVSVFLNLYAYVPQCYGSVVVSSSFLSIIRQLINPFVNFRIGLEKATELLTQELQFANNQDYLNPTYSPYNKSSFVSVSRQSVLSKQRSVKNMI